MNIGFEAKRVFHNTTGLGNYSRDLIRIMHRYYPQNRYVLYNPKAAKKTLFEAPGDQIIEKRPSGFFQAIFHNTWRRYGILKDLKRDKIDLFHGLSGEIPAGLSDMGIKSIVTIHDLIFLRYPQYYSFIDRNIYYQKFKHAAQAADLILAISEQTKKDVVEFLDVDARKVKVVYQGCHQAFKEVYSEAQKDAVRKKYHLPDNFILNVGTIEPRKNILAAVKALQNTDQHLVIVGRKTPYAEEIMAFINQHAMQQRVHFLAGLSPTELAILYQLATIFVYPSHFEGFGIPIIEALFSKTPVITSKGSCFPEAGGPHSIYIDPKKPEQITDAIHTILQNEALAKTMALNGFEYAQKFQDERIAQELMASYQFLVKA